MAATPQISASDLSATIASIAALKNQYLTIRPQTPLPVLQIPPERPFFIPATPPPSFTFNIPDAYQLQLYTYPGPYPTSSTASSITPTYTLTSISDHTIPFAREKPFAYHAILAPTPETVAALTRLEELRTTQQEQLKTSNNFSLHAIDDESPESLSLRLSLPTASTLALPAFLLHAIAALGDLLPRAYTTASQELLTRFSLITSPDPNGSIPSMIQATFENSSDQILLNPDGTPFLANDPILIAFYALSVSISDSDDIDNNAVRKESAFAELFKTLAKRCIVWHISNAWSPSFAWTIEMGTIRNFLVPAPEFKDAPFLLPVNVRTGIETTINVGVAPGAGMSYLYSVQDAPVFLARQPHVVDALVAAVHYGADWDSITKPDGLSRVRNTASYKMNTSGGVLYNGVYIDSSDDIASLLMFGKVNNVKLVDISTADDLGSRALQNLATAIDAVRTFTKTDAKTFKTTFGATLGDMRRTICRQVAEEGLIFKRDDRYLWIGCDDAGVMRLKKAVLFDGDKQTLELPLPDMGERELSSVESEREGEAVGRTSYHWTSQDLTFLVQNVDGTKLESTSEIRKYAGDAGMLVLLAAARFGRVALEASFTHALITQRMPVKWAVEDGNADVKGVKVDTMMKYAYLFVLEDYVIVDHDGQGWIYAMDYLRGRQGAPGKIMKAETEGCAPMRIVEVEFSVSEEVLVSP